MSETDEGRKQEHLEKVKLQLSRYEHPLFEWHAEIQPSGIDVVIRLRTQGVYDESYRLLLREREIDARGFEWDFQRQLFNCLHDFVVEMFTRSPHIVEI